MMKATKIVLKCDNERLMKDISDTVREYDDFKNDTNNDLEIDIDETYMEVNINLVSETGEFIENLKCINVDEYINIVWE